MGIDHSNPYIHCTTILCDMSNVNLAGTRVVRYLIEVRNLEYPLKESLL